MGEVKDVTETPGPTLERLERMANDLKSAIHSCEFKALQLRQKARGLEKQADEVDTEATSYLTTFNAISLLAEELTKETEDYESSE